MVTFPILQFYEVPHIYSTFFQTALGRRTHGHHTGSTLFWRFWRYFFPHGNVNEIGKLVHLGTQPSSFNTALTLTLTLTLTL